MEVFFSKNLQYLRRINKVSQTKIAELVGKVPTAIGSWEKGVNQPSVSDVMLLADFFKVDLGLLLSENLEERSYSDSMKLFDNLHAFINDQIVVESLEEVKDLLNDTATKIQAVIEKVKDKKNAGLQIIKEEDDIF